MVKICKEGTTFIVSNNMQPSKNHTLYKTPKSEVPTDSMGCIKAIENLAILLEKKCAELTENIPTKQTILITYFIYLKV